jgi:small subunit ribosomal protein S16
MAKTCLKGAVSAILRCCVFHLVGGIRRREPRIQTRKVSFSGIPRFTLFQRQSAMRARPARDSQRTQQSTGFERNSIAVVMIRLARVGAPKQPYYRVVVIEKDRARNGRSIEVVGTYNPRTNPASVDLKHERIAYWRGVGAQLTPIVAKLVEKNPAQAVPAAV